jgi:hypothetical protein
MERGCLAVELDTEVGGDLVPQSLWSAAMRAGGFRSDAPTPEVEPAAGNHAAVLEALAPARRARL